MRPRRPGNEKIRCRCSTNSAQQGRIVKFTPGEVAPATDIQPGEGFSPPSSAGKCRHGPLGLFQQINDTRPAAPVQVVSTGPRVSCLGKSNRAGNENRLQFRRGSHQLLLHKIADECRADAPVRCREAERIGIAEQRHGLVEKAVRPGNEGRADTTTQGPRSAQPAVHRRFRRIAGAQGLSGGRGQRGRPARADPHALSGRRTMSEGIDRQGATTRGSGASARHSHDWLSSVPAWSCTALIRNGKDITVADSHQGRRDDAQEPVGSRRAA